MEERCARKIRAWKPCQAEAPSKRYHAGFLLDNPPG